jgi:glycosyltransferase involved in cell wall biosynthesis
MSHPVPVLLVESGRQVGGTERVVEALARGLDREQFQPWVVLSPAPALDAWADELRRAAVPVERREEITNRFQVSRIAGWIRFLRRHRRSLLHVHHVWPSADRYLVPIAHLSGIRAVVVTEHLSAPPHSAWQRLLKRWESVRTDVHVTVSQAVADALAQSYGLSRDSLEVVPNGVRPPRPLAAEERSRVRAGWGAQDGRRVWLAVGRLEDQKGFDLLLEAWARLHTPRPRLVVLGEGSRRGPLEAQSRVLGLAGDVHFAGAWLDAEPAYAAADAFVLSSRFEGLPLSLLEALCAGLPAVATAVGGVPEATEFGRRARLVAAPEAGALAEAVAEVESHLEAARQRAQAGQAWAGERFGLGRMVDEYESLYRRALRHARSAVPRDRRRDEAA